MVQTELFGLSAKQDSRAEFMLLEVECMEDAWVVETLQNPKFLKGSSTN
jgi:hypothetical protein